MNTMLNQIMLTGSSWPHQSTPSDTPSGAALAEAVLAGAMLLAGCGSSSDAGADANQGLDSTANANQTAAAPQGLPSLSEKYAEHFVVGAAIDGDSYRDAHVELLQKHFNAVVCENEMKWNALQEVEGVFDFSTADAMVQFAEDNSMTVRGHTLVWHDQTPAWVFQDETGGTVSKEVLLERMTNHVTNVVSHYQGRVQAWDVVNEAIVGYDGSGADVGENVGSADTWGYRNSSWYTIAGDDYIVEAFRAARQADPDAKLFYNDYWNYLDDKREAILSIVERLQAENLIDGVGLQCHLNISTAQEIEGNQTSFQTVENLGREIDAYAALGLDVHITELDISIYTRDYGSSDESRWYLEDELNEEYQDLLAARYREFFDLFRSKSDVISNVTFWGIADDNTWLSEFSSGRPDHPLLFDRSLEPKKAFFAITDF